MRNEVTTLLFVSCLGLILVSYQNCAPAIRLQNEPVNSDTVNKLNDLNDKDGALVTNFAIGEEDLRIASEWKVALEAAECPGLVSGQSAGPGEGGLWVHTQSAGPGEGGLWDRATQRNLESEVWTEERIKLFLSQENCDLPGFYLMYKVIQSAAGCLVPTTPTCVPTGKYNWSPAGDLKRYPCAQGKRGSSDTLSSPDQCT